MYYNHNAAPNGANPTNRCGVISLCIVLLYYCIAIVFCANFILADSVSADSITKKIINLWDWLLVGVANECYLG